MAPGGVEASTLEVDEGKGRARDRQGRRVLANCRVLENLESGIAGPLEVAREEESAGIDVLGAVDERIPADRRDLERTTAVQHCLADTVVQHHRPCNQREALYVDVGLPDSLSRARSASWRYLCRSMLPLPCSIDAIAAATVSSECSTTTSSGERANPGKQRPARSVADQREVILDEDVRNELVISASAAYRTASNGRPRALNHAAVRLWIRVDSPGSCTASSALHVRRAVNGSDTTRPARAA